MLANDRDPENEDRIYGADLHPRHEAWARFSVRSSMIGLAIFIVLGVAFVLWVQWH